MDEADRILSLDYEKEVLIFTLAFLVQLTVPMQGGQNPENGPQRTHHVSVLGDHVREGKPHARATIAT